MKGTPSLALCRDQCGARCCRAPGSIRVSRHEARKLNTWAGRELVYREVPDWHPEMVLLNFSENGGQCPLLAPDRSCSIYPYRPVGCHLFPQAPHEECLVWPRR